MANQKEIRRKKEEGKKILVNMGSSSLNKNLKNDSNKRKAASSKITTKRKTKNKKREKNLKKWVESENFPKVLRMAFLFIILGVFLFNYYLLTENKLFSLYGGLWAAIKDVFVPVVIFIIYTIFVYRMGYLSGKKKKK